MYECINLYVKKTIHGPINILSIQLQSDEW